VELVTLVATVALLEYAFFGYQVGLARGRYGIEPPGGGRQSNV
jgi:hypothetical protein